jgi:hypothetical protein
VRWVPSCAWNESIFASASMYMRVLHIKSAIITHIPHSHPSRDQCSKHICPLLVQSRITHPLGKLKSKSFCGPSEKLATLNQLTPLLPFSSFEPVLTPTAYLITSRPVEVGLTEGVSASLPMSCIFARALGVVVEKARAPARGTADRRANILVVCGYFVVRVLGGCEVLWETDVQCLASWDEFTYSTFRRARCQLQTRWEGSLKRVTEAAQAPRLHSHFTSTRVGVDNCTNEDMLLHTMKYRIHPPDPPYIWVSDVLNGRPTVAPMQLGV